MAARIERLTHQRDTLAANDADLRAALRGQIVELSTHHRVLCDFTALLVLQSEGDYSRFRIDRRALTDILVVGTTGVELLHPTEPPPTAWTEARGRSPATTAAAPDGQGLSATAAPPPVGGPDRDGDRIPDAFDRCPYEPETYNGFQDEDGCPDKGRVLVMRGKLEILDKIYFARGDARIKPVSDPLLDAIAATIKGNPQLQQSGRSGKDNVAGCNGLTVQLANVSEVTNQPEQITLSTTELNNGSMLYVIGVAPRDEAGRYDDTFKRVRQQIQIADR